MTLIFFEGFETVGDTTGSGEASDVMDRVELRMDVPTPIGSSDFWLVDNHDLTGFAVNMGTGFGTVLEIPFPTAFQYFTGADSPIMTLGIRVHPPDDPTDFEIARLIVDNGSGGSESDVNLRCVGSEDLQVRNGSTVLETVVGVLTPGEWTYLEWAVRADGGTGRYATAEVQSTPTEFSDELPITNVVSYRKIWDSTETYAINDEVRWKGRAYTSLLSSNLDNEPDSSPMYWDDDGLEDAPANLGNTVDNFSQFYIVEDPNKTVRTHNGGAGSPPTTLDGTPVYDYGTYYEPQAGDTVIIGGNAYSEVRLEGGLIMHNQSFNIGFNVFRYWNRLELANNSVAGTGDDFVGYDDIYVTDDKSTQAGFLGPSVVVSLPPTADTNQDWTTSSGVDHYALVDENGADSADYVEAASNGLIDRFSHEDSIGDGEIYAVKIEAEAINTTSGTPTIEVSMGSSGQISDTFTVDDTVNYNVFQFTSTTKPGGGSWTFSDLDALESGIESAGL